MGSLLAYSGLTTKVRAMQSRLITRSQFEEISELTSVGDLVIYLQQHPGYSNTFSEMNPAEIHRGDIEKMLRFDIFRDFTKIYNFASPKQRRFLDMYFMKYEVQVLKRYLRMIFDSRHVIQPYVVNENDFELHSKIKTDVVSQSATVEEFINNLKGTQYYDPLFKLSRLDNLRLFDYEMCLDLYEYSVIWRSRTKYFKGEELEVMTHSYGVRIDMLNIAWIYRAKKYFNISDKEIYSLLIPVNYRLKKAETKSLVEAEDLNSFHNALNQSHYGKYLHDDSGKFSLEQLESRVLAQVHIKDYKKDPYSLATVSTYLYLKEKEIQKIVTATECIRYGFKPADILTQLAY